MWQTIELLEEAKKKKEKNRDKKNFRNLTSWKRRRVEQPYGIFFIKLWRLILGARRHAVKKGEDVLATLSPGRRQS